MAVSVRLLGGFAAAVDGVVVPDTAWRLKKARELVKLLALARGHRLHREQAMDVLWRELAPAAAANNLHQAVHVARRALDADAIEVRDEVLVARGARRRRRPARARRRGRAPRRDAGGLPRRALALPRRAAAGEPLRRLGRGAPRRARGAGRRARGGVGGARLGDDRSRCPRMRARSSAASASSPSWSRCSGARACSRSSGTGGVGKTRLALELARAAEPSYEAGAALVELAALADPRLVPDAVAAALDVRALPAQDARRRGGRLPRAARRCCSCSTTASTCSRRRAALADTLLRAAPQLTILATSREPLRVPGEVVFRVPSLDIPDPEQPLAARRAARATRPSRSSSSARPPPRPASRSTSENAEDVARICFRLDGLPLALELAAGRLGALEPRGDRRAARRPLPPPAHAAAAPRRRGSRR